MPDSVPVATGSPSDDWVSLRIDLPIEIAEAVTSFLLDAGAPGVITEDRDLDGPAHPASRARLEAPVRAADHVRVATELAKYLLSLAELEPAARDARVTTAPVPPVDWMAVARAHHRPLSIGRRLLVVPPWEVPGSSEREILVIEPGMAFGTGQHATTRSCLEAIEGVLDAAPIGAALDVGTGSGVLALALARLGVARVVALDLDPAVLPLARATLLRNGAPHVLLLAGTVAAVRLRADLVVANLLADTIVAEAPALGAAVRPGGRLVLSGILVVQAPAVRNAFPGWSLADTRTVDGWETMTLRRAG
jgi:ribosomal protein L11 methyltransferase